MGASLAGWIGGNQRAASEGRMKGKQAITGEQRKEKDENEGVLAFKWFELWGRASTTDTLTEHFRSFSSTLPNIHYQRAFLRNPFSLVEVYKNAFLETLWGCSIIETGHFFASSNALPPTQSSLVVVLWILPRAILTSPQDSMLSRYQDAHASFHGYLSWTKGICIRNQTIHSTSLLMVAVPKPLTANNITPRGFHLERVSSHHLSQNGVPAARVTVISRREVD